MSHLINTRTLEAEHSYPEPNRNHLSMHNREAAKRRVGYKTKASEVRRGYRAKDGTTYLFPTQSEMHEARMQTLANERLAKQQRQQDLMQRINDQIAKTDSWAAKQ